MADKPDDVLKPVSPGEVALKMKIDYSRGVKDHVTKNLDAVTQLCRRLERPVDLTIFATEAADLICKNMAIESVAVCVRDPDRFFRYKSTVGLDDGVANALRALSYRRDELLESSTYPNHEISERTRLFLAEEHPYASGEENTYRRPGLMGLRRRTVTDCLEADYLDFFFHGTDGDIAGFIETSGTRLKKLPDTETIRWIELVAEILGLAFRRTA